MTGEISGKQPHLLIPSPPPPPPPTFSQTFLSPGCLPGAVLSISHEQHHFTLTKAGEVGAIVPVVHRGTCRRRSWRGNPGERLTTRSCILCQFSAGHCARWAPRPGPFLRGQPTWAPAAPGTAHRQEREHEWTVATPGLAVVPVAPRASSGSGPLPFGGHGEDLAHIWGAHPQPRSALTCEKTTSFSANGTSEELNFLWRCPGLTNLLGEHC